LSRRRADAGGEGASAGSPKSWASIVDAAGGLPPGPAAPTGSPPMLCLPSSLDMLLVLLAPAFTRPSFRTFRALLVGQLSQTGLRTVTGMLVGARPVGGLASRARASLLQRGALVGGRAGVADGRAGRRAALRPPARRCWSPSMTRCCTAWDARSTGRSGLTTRPPIATAPPSRGEPAFRAGTRDASDGQACLPRHQ
jgi:hypothetical protein